MATLIAPVHTPAKIKMAGHLRRLHTSKAALIPAPFWAACMLRSLIPNVPQPCTLPYYRASRRTQTKTLDIASPSQSQGLLYLPVWERGSVGFVAIRLVYRLSKQHYKHLMEYLKTVRDQCRWPLATLIFFNLFEQVTGLYIRPQSPYRPL